MPIKPIPVAIYCRVSDPDDPRETSFDLQEKECRKYASDRGWSVVAVYKDRYTGTELYDRPQLSTMRDNIRARKYTIAIIWKLDRLGREPAHWSILFDEAERYSCRYESATEDIENTPEGELLRNIRGYVAKVERIKILERTQGAVKHIVQSGKPICSGKARFGYAYSTDNRTRIIVEEHAAIVRRIFDLSASGKSYRVIAAQLNSEGVPSPSVLRGRKYKDNRVCKWTKTSLHEIITDPSYYGKPMSWNKTKATDKRIKETGRSVIAKTAKADWTTLADPTPPIVSRELWDRANNCVVGRDKAGDTRNIRKFRMLRGMITCGVCGRTMSTQSVAKWTKSKGRYEFYVCMSTRPDDLKGIALQCGNGRTQIHYADSEVRRQVTEFLKDKDSIKAKILASTNADQNLDSELESHKACIVKAESIIRRLIDRLGDEDDDTIVSMMRDKITSTKETIKEHNRSIEELEARVWAKASRDMMIRIFSMIADHDPENPISSPEHMPDWFNQEYYGAFIEWLQSRTDPSPEQFREILLALGCRVQLKRQEVTVSLDLPSTEPLAGCPNSVAEKAPRSAPGASAIH